MTVKLRIAVSAALICWIAACSKDELLNVDPEQAPGFAPPTLEVILTPENVNQWIDSVFGGFANASTSSFMLLNNGSPSLSSRGLVVFSAPIQDSIFFGDTLSAALGYDSLRMIIGIDSLRSQVSSAGTTFQLWSVLEEWDDNSADWDFAVDSSGVSVPWTGGPGGSLGVVLSETTLTEEQVLVEGQDTVVFDLTPYTDSLLNAWADTSQANTGLAIVVADSGSLLVGLPRLQYYVIPESFPDTAIEIRCPGTNFAFCVPSFTYIFDASAQPPPVGVLQVGGVDGWRSYTQLFLPDSVQLEDTTVAFSLRGATINKAQFVIRSLAAPPVPFAAEGRIDGAAYELADDYTLLGPKTPVGPLIDSSSFTIDPDSLEAGSEVVIDITAQVQTWADIPFDSIVPPITLTIRAFPEGTTFGYWNFGAEDGDPAFAPVLRIVFTPEVRFPFP